MIKGYRDFNNRVERLKNKIKKPVKIYFCKDGKLYRKNFDGEYVGEIENYEFPENERSIIISIR